MKLGEGMREELEVAEAEAEAVRCFREKRGVYIGSCVLIIKNGRSQFMPIINKINLLH